jgi:hypothetical protein
MTALRARLRSSRRRSPRASFFADLAHALERQADDSVTMCACSEAAAGAAAAHDRRCVA